MPGEWCEWKGRRRGVHLGVKDQGELRAKKLLLTLGTLGDFVCTATLWNFQVVQEKGS